MPCLGIQAARKHFSSKYLQYEFKQSTVNNRKNKITKGLESQEGQFTEGERPNKFNDKVMLKIKEVIIGIRLAGALISRKMVTSIGARVLIANNRNSLSEFEENVILTDMWARGALKSMDCDKCKGISEKVETS